jgi:hypothetical protein
MQPTPTNRSAKLVLSIVLALVLVGAGVGVYFWQRQVSDLDHQVSGLREQNTKQSAQIETNKQNSGSYTSKKGVSVSVYTPTKNGTVKSAQWVLGSVPGNWSFEASFPVVLKNSSGDVVAEGIAELLDDWMTTNQVPFKVKLEWKSNQTGTGNLVLQKDNPSGLPKNDDSVEIPVKF